MDPVSHPASRNREHPSELAAAEHAKSAARSDRVRLAEAEAKTGSRQAFLTDFLGLLVAKGASFARRSGRELARMDTASSPALIAPARPIASVPTGTPPGAWTIDSNESRPCSAAL